MNGDAFTNLPRLKYITLNDNHCIDRYFYHSTDRDFSGITKTCGFPDIGSVDIGCESYTNFLLIQGESCNMNNISIINSPNFVMADMKDEQLKFINFFGNEKVEYLLYKIYMQFPNLMRISAYECSIKQISKQNFENLIRLEQINLRQNLILKIYGDTFKGLESLRLVDLSKFTVLLSPESRLN